jgi:hypothetical protein
VSDPREALPVNVSDEAAALIAGAREAAEGIWTERDVRALPETRAILTCGDGDASDCPGCIPTWSWPLS